MTIIYKCDKCGAKFKDPKECRICEASHMNPIDRVKYMILLECESVCDYCNNSYYVYGIEQSCEHKDCYHGNNYKDFVPTEPLHDKSKNGGI